MPIDDRTPGRSYQLPNLLNLLVEDWPRLRAALMAIDEDISARPTLTVVNQLISDRPTLTVVNQLISDVIAGSPEALNTLNELAAALGDDANFAGTLTNLLALKSPLASPTFTGTPTAPTAPVGTNTTQLATTAFVIGQGYAPIESPVFTGSPQFLSINNGPLAGFRNAIINGNFDVWQQATSHSTAGYGSADRWNNDRVGSSCTISRQIFPLGQTEVPGNPKYFCRAVVSSSAASANYSALQQRIEGVNTFAGQTITVRFWAKADAARPIAIELVQNFGTGGSPSASVVALAVTKVALGTAWQDVRLTATLPSISGKTLGTNNDDSLALLIWFDAGSDFNARTNSLGQQSGTFDIAQLQVELGLVATPFERRPVVTELSLCKRYGQWVPFNMRYATGMAAAEAALTWPEMRRTPVVGSLVADPNTSQENSNISASFIGRATPYGGSCTMNPTNPNQLFSMTGYRSWLDAEL
jgi:hypothetical protein